jgi:hypothetical protein
VDKLESVSIKIVTVEKDRVYANFYATGDGVTRFLGGRAMFEGDEWEVRIPMIPVVRKVDYA